MPIPDRHSTAEQAPVIEVRDLRMRYGSADVLVGVDLTATRGEVVALLGPNGAGKTTTIEILEGFRVRSAGEVQVLGVNGWLFLSSAGVITISGIFYPITALPGWLHPIAQTFPFYWVGLGTRSALLPDAAATVELTGTWRPLTTVAVLGLWAVVGLALAPVVLGRMARRQSGAGVEENRRKAMQRIG